MFKPLEQFKKTMLGFFLIELIIIALSYFYLRNILYIILFFLLLITTAYLFAMYVVFYNQYKNHSLSIKTVLGKEASDGFVYGKIGLVAFNESFEITWMNELFDEQSSYIGEKLSTWIPELSQLVRDGRDTIHTTINDRYYEVTRVKSGQMLFFKDQSDFIKANKSYQDNKIVLGLIHFDNYEEETQYEDEQKIATIDLQLRQPVVIWAKEHGIYLRRIRSDRFLIVLTEQIFNQLQKEGFSILSQIRRNSNKYNLSITLSISFALGTSDLTRLDEISNRSLELAQGRGGDQVAVKKEGEDIRYYGGTTQTQEKGSKVRVRVLSNTLRELILQSSNVIIVGHTTMDFDCFGAAIGVSRIVQNYKKPVSIVTYSGGIETKLNQALELYEDDLKTMHTLITQETALSELKPRTLVIMVDHHSIAQTNAPKLIEKANKIAIIDHHRRTRDFEFNPLFAYIEQASSSTCEMITEFFMYQMHQVKISDIEATIMFAGVLIDTNYFSTRTGARTFETAATLRSLGANPTEASNFLKDDYEEFELKTAVLNKAIKYENYIIVPYEDQVLSRTMISIVANELLKVSGIEASFVISPLGENKIGISARSKGQFNVQMVMEAMGGGGHFSMAAVQKDATTVSEMADELLNEIAAQQKMEG